VRPYGFTTNVTATMTVVDSALHASGLDFSAIPNQAFSGKVASFIDDDPNAVAADYSVLI